METAAWESLLWQPLHLAKAKFDYKSSHLMDLNFQAGDIIEVLGIENDEWWNGSIPNLNRFGSFPKIYVEVIDDEQSTQANEATKQTKVTRNDSLTQATRTSTNQQQQRPKLPPRERPGIRRSSTMQSQGSIEDENDSASTTSSNNRSSIRSSRATSTYSLASRNSEAIMEEKIDPLSGCTVIVGDDYQGPLDMSDVDFDVVDEYARATPPEEESSVKRLAKYLVKDWSHPIYQLRCIFTWVAHNIEYDIESFESGNIKSTAAKDVLRSRRAVCAGYSELFHELAMAANVGLNTWKISGNAKGAGYQPGDPIEGRAYAHAWNGVMLEEEYLLIDCTWGAGICTNHQFKREFEPFFFLCSPAHLIHSHFPDDKRHQYLDPPITNAEFNELPYFKPKWFEHGYRLTRHQGCTIEVSNDKVVLDIEHVVTQDSDGTEIYPVCHLQWNGRQIACLVNRVGGTGENGGRLYRVDCGVPCGGEGILNLYSFKNSSGPFSAGFKIINNGDGTNYKPFATTYSAPFSYSLVSPVYSTVPYNKRVRFEVIVFDVAEEDVPELLIYAQGWKKKKTLEFVRRNSAEKSVYLGVECQMSFTGEWVLAHNARKAGQFYHVAVFECK